MALDFVTTAVAFAFVVGPEFYHGPELLSLILSFFRLGRGGVPAALVFLVRFCVVLHIKASLSQDFFFMLVQVAALYAAGAQFCRRI